MRALIRSTVVRKARIMSFEDILESQKKRDEKDVAAAGRRARKRKKAAYAPANSRGQRSRAEEVEEANREIDALGSGLSLNPSRVSSRPRKTSIRDMKTMMALARLGVRYGQDIIHRTPFWPPKTESGPKTFGYVPAGSASTPPRIGPMITPMLKYIGMRRNAARFGRQINWEDQDKETGSCGPTMTGIAAALMSDDGHALDRAGRRDTSTSTRALRDGARQRAS